MNDNPRRRIPRTDLLLALPEVRVALGRVSKARVREAVDEVLRRARAGELAPEAVEGAVVDAVGRLEVSSLHPVINATGVIVHTNLGRAPLSPAATRAMVDAAGYTDVELDLGTGRRSAYRGAGVITALLEACPAAQDALVVNNGAAALLLACAALAEDREVLISRGELIEIGAGFRLPELIESARVTLKEVGATNRTHLQDYQQALGDNTGAVVKVHPSNYLISGFTAAVGTAELAGLGVPLIVDLGSGLLAPEPKLPEEPDIAAQLRAGADVVIASGDKLLGGPQAGILLGTGEAIAKLKSHPLARAVRMDKVRLAALEATVASGENLVRSALYADTHARTQALAHATGGQLVEHSGRVGGGGAPEYPLPGFAAAYPEGLAAKLRQHGVLARVKDSRCLVDLRCVPAARDAWLTGLIRKLV
ncbi:selenocysteine synthase [Corynebacterium phocae]|uniref:L-seryl-tRNA(Sec) selenium transferase n=1 Tax=Corynebacterium phocae TaxID=161895 RepID=A0A1L7D6H6_9CORY|nr:L-seryl-tRNA(Sec) selenium transferase [Corynebacterium phocae]APT93744.1 selenocysteine synthase [Corynebacterium phocae]KAA8723149.1 L-seryl-tRNA(Sec) selenium transferase [Corynebacterium phocae]